uniref:Glycosyltransferase 61 catalytic domain-containing protein n=1 Tax=Craspedostauros australis TaxID=1486917 RepID=A0A7S0F6L4_9STRA|mmetsp:Transcript_8431/g.22824  ORF Transcript_8431/g.22824 Transcript_8431/m.22824 type:complete len:485 (+) Transcript_8431:129-1583(+)
MSSRSANSGIPCSLKAVRFIVALSIFGFSLMTWTISLRMLNSSKYADDPFTLGNAFKHPTGLLAEHPDRWTRNITEFPAFMLQWPTDPFDANGCNILNISIPHTFNVTNYPTSYDLLSVFGDIYGNLTEAWNQVDAATIHGAETKVVGTENGRQKQIKTVVCTVKNHTYVHHFPHQMQQIFPCWSLWRHFPDANHVFIARKPFFGQMTEGSAFTEGMVKVLKASNVTLIQQHVKFFKGDHRSHLDELLIAHAHRIEGYQTVYDDDLQYLRRRTLAALGMGHHIDQSCGRTQPGDGMSTSQTTSTAAGTGEANGGVASSIPGSKFRPPRIAIANRNGTRRMLGAHKVAIFFQKDLQLPYRPPVFFIENMSFEQQVEAFNTVDILLTPHGAQLTLIPFMHRCSSVIEVLPRAYDWSEFFGRLAAIAGVNHSYIYLGTDIAAEAASMASFDDQMFVRKSLVCAPAHAMVAAVKTQIDRWHQCCEDAD